LIPIPFLRKAFVRSRDGGRRKGTLCDGDKKIGPIEIIHMVVNDKESAVGNYRII